MNKQEFLDYLTDPVGASIERGVAEFHKRWEGNIDVLNLIETTNRPKGMARHWMVQVFTTDELLVRSFQDSLIHYATKHHPSAWINTGRYDSGSCLLHMGILEYDEGLR